MKRVLIVMIVVVVLMLAAQVAAYAIALNSEAYAEAARSLREDVSIASQIGAVETISLAPFDTEMRFTGESGNAAFVLTASTTRGKHKIRVLLEKRATAWKVLSTQVLS